MNEILDAHIGTKSRHEIDWHDLDSPALFFLNDRYTRHDAQVLTAGLSKRVSEFKGHLILLSSGTSGKAKWIALGKEAFLISAHAVNQHLSVSKRDSWLLTLPRFHVGGLGILARAHLSGSKVFPLEGKWESEGFVLALKQNQCTLSSLVPTQIYDLVSKNLAPPSSLRAVFVGGSSLNADLGRKAQVLGWPLLTTYGMTETCSQVASATIDNRFQLSPIPILPHWEVSETEGGILQFRGRALLSAYIYVDEKEVRIEDPKTDTGWFVSQDRGEVHAGLLTVLGRIGDVVKVLGENVDLARLNEKLSSLLDRFKMIADCALVAIPHERLGMQVGLVADHRLSEIQANHLIETFNQEVLPFEKIRAWKSLETLPRTILGKLIVSSCVEAWGYSRS